MNTVRNTHKSVRQYYRKLNYIEFSRKNSKWAILTAIGTLATAIVATAASIISLYQAQIAMSAREDAYNQIRLDKQIESCSSTIESLLKFKTRYDEALHVQMLQAEAQANREKAQKVLKGTSIIEDWENLFAQKNQILSAYDSLVMNSVKARLVLPNEIIKTLDIMQETINTMYFDILFQKRSLHRATLPTEYETQMSTLRETCRNLTQRKSE